MARDEENRRYRIELQAEWALEDLYNFPRVYQQVYYFYESYSPILTEDEMEKIQGLYQAFPWQGGYSSVNFFHSLMNAFDRERRMTFLSIHKASPGWLDVGLTVGTAYSIARIIRLLCASIEVANETYTNIMKGMNERKILRVERKRMDMQFSREEISFIEDSASVMARMLGFKGRKEVDNLTGDAYISLKILLSAFRRVRYLARYVAEGKARLSTTEPPNPPPSPRPRRKVRQKPPVSQNKSKPRIRSQRRSG